MQAIDYAILSESTIMQKIVEAQQKEIQHLKWQLSHDSLTGLLNRRGMYEAYASHKYRYVYAIDADNLKQVNDTHGHAAGDLLLQEVADICRHMADLGGGVAVRLGGDEFVVLTDRMVVVNASEQATFSRGWSPAVGDLDAALKVADTRMYSNKRTRKAQR